MECNEFNTVLTKPSAEMLLKITETKKRMIKLQ